MPQLDVSTFPTQLVWLVIAFIALYAMLTRTALPAVGAVLEKRQKHIGDNLDKAAALKAEAESALAAYEKALAKAKDEAHAVVREVADKLTAEATDRQHALADQLSQRIKDAEANIEASKNKALDGIRAVAAEVAKAATGRLTGIDIKDTDVSAAIDAALREHA